MCGNDSGVGFDTESNDDLPAHYLNQCGPLIDVYQSESSDSESKTSELEWVYYDDDDDDGGDDNDGDGDDDNDEKKSGETIQSKSDDDYRMGFLYDSDDNLHNRDLNLCGPSIKYY